MSNSRFKRDWVQVIGPHGREYKPVNECKQVTLGPSKGRFVHPAVCPFVEHKGHVWVRSEETDAEVSQVFVRNPCGEILLREQAIKLADKEGRNRWFSKEMGKFIEDENKWVSKDNNDYRWSERLGKYINVNSDKYRYVHGDFWEREEVEDCNGCGVPFPKEWGDCFQCSVARSEVKQYHQSPDPKMLAKPNNWKIGFEVEKIAHGDVRDIGDVLESQPLFAGWEVDRSCGVEGVTHVYPLRGVGSYHMFKSDVLASPHVDAPIDNNCGGHVNISAPGLTLDMIRKYVGLIYAMYRIRLKKGQSSNHGPEPFRNKRLEDREVGNRDNHYDVINPKQNNIFEYRLVDKLKNTKQLLFRFKLFAELAKAVDGEVTFPQYLAMSRAPLSLVYSESEIRQKLFPLAIKFQRWVDTGNSHKDIEPYIK